MRTIKFRGKRVDNGEWVYGDLHHRAGRELAIVIPAPDEHGIWYFASHLVKSDTVGQFTGLTDKNGKEIYEGDVVANDFGNGLIVNMEVKWYAGGGYWALQELAGDDTMHFVADYLKEIDVIGNIHDTPPELLSE